MMNTILSIIVCFAMILGGTGTMPAQPETAATWTIRNLTIDNGAESVTLAPEARITTALGAEQALVHFEIGSGEQTLMPASGEITADGVRFSLGGSGRSYSVSEDAFMELTGMSGDDMQIFAVVGDFFKNYGTVLGKAMYDQEFALKFSEVSMQALMDACGSVTETEVEVEGVTYPAQQLHFDITGAAAMAMLDEMRSCGIAEVEAMIESCIDLVNLTEGTEFTSFKDLAGEVEEDVSFPMDVVIVVQDDFAYEAASTEIEDEASGMVMNMNVEAIARGEETQMTMSMIAGDDNTAMTYEIAANMTGPADAPAAMDMTCGVYVVEDYSYAAETGDEEVYASTSEMSMFVTLSSVFENGLENTQISAIVDTFEESGSGDDVEGYGQSFAVEAGCEEALEADGSITSSWSIEVGMGEDPWLVSFDINRAEGEVTDYFADTTDFALTPEVMNATEETPAEMVMLGSDAMSFMTDAYVLMADESVMELINMFAVVEETVQYETETVEEYDEYEAYEEEEISTVYSFEEAAQIFRGEIPAYTAPEGYELTEIMVDSYTLNAIYDGANRSFQFMTYDYDNEGVSYYSLTDGALKPVEGAMVQLYEYDGYVSSADVFSGSGVTYFYFDNMDMAEAQAVLAGLN